MGPKTTPSLISRGGYQIPPPLGGREIDTPWEIGLTFQHFNTLAAPELNTSTVMTILRMVRDHSGDVDIG